jgi:beta-galactosidase
VTAEEATIQIQVWVTNQSTTPQTFVLQATVIGDDSKGVNHPRETVTVDGGSVKEFKQTIVVKQPAIWDLDSPRLYLALVNLFDGKYSFDKESAFFGIRDAKFTPDLGFILNGRKVMLKGVCLHHDGGALGAAVPLGVWEQRLTALRGLGCNAIRTSHNPVAPEFLDLCDLMGFLVMDEFFDCWTIGKNREDYHKNFEEWSLIDLRDTVQRDRNHPSIILYSAGNEIHDTPKPQLAKRILAGLVKEYKANDPTRPVTQGLFRPNTSGDYTNGLADLLDVVGTNYRDKELLAAQRAKPERKIVGTEQRHDRETWLNLRDNPSHAGQFLWTGVDYLGESKQWPRVGHASGLLDRTGAVKPRAYERASWWSDAPMVSICRRVAPDDKMPTDPGYGGAELHTQVEFADWTPRNPAPHDESVQAYSNCEEVELFLNGKSLGAKKINADATPRMWKVPFVPGSLRAVAKNEGKIVAQDELRTAGAPAAIKLETPNAKLGAAWDDVAIVRACIVDKDGVVVPRANDLVAFTVTGPGVLAAVDNGDNDSSEPFQARERKAYGGRCVAFIRATAGIGEITVTAAADGLKPASVNIKAVPGRAAE